MKCLEPKKTKPPIIVSIAEAEVGAVAANNTGSGPIYRKALHCTALVDDSSAIFTIIMHFFYCNFHSLIHNLIITYHQFLIIYTYTYTYSNSNSMICDNTIPIRYTSRLGNLKSQNCQIKIRTNKWTGR